MNPPVCSSSDALVRQSADHLAAGTGASIVDLRALLRERFPGAHAGAAASIAKEPTVASSPPLSGVPALDALQPPMGELIEVVCPQPGRGGALLLHQLVQQAAARGQPLALVDGSDSFDPDSLAPPCGVSGRLLWLRCHGAAESMRVADLLLRDGNLDLLLVDLQLNSGRDITQVPDSSWHRLRMLMRGTHRHCLIFTPRRTVPRAALRVRLGGALRLDALDRPRAELLGELQFEPLRQQTPPQTEDASGTRARNVG